MFIVGDFLPAGSHSFPRNNAANHAGSTLLSESSECVPLLWFRELLRLSWVTFEVFSKDYGQDSQDRSLQDPRPAGLSMTSISKPLFPVRPLRVVSEGELANGGSGPLTDTQGFFSRLSRQLAWSGLFSFLLMALKSREGAAALPLHGGVTVLFSPVIYYTDQSQSSQKELSPNLSSCDRHQKSACLLFEARGCGEICKARAHVPV